MSQLSHPPPFAPEGMIFQLFMTTHRLGREFKRIAQAYGLTRTQSMILGRLAQEDVAFTATDFRQCLGVTAASMSTSLAEMERQGLIERTPHPDDARAMLVHLTEQGRQIVAMFPAQMHEIEERAFGGLTEGERIQLRRLLERVRANLGNEESADEFVCMGVPEERIDLG